MLSMGAYLTLLVWAEKLYECYHYFHSIITNCIVRLEIVRNKIFTLKYLGNTDFVIYSYTLHASSINNIIILLFIDDA